MSTFDLKPFIQSVLLKDQLVVAWSVSSAFLLDCLKDQSYVQQHTTVQWTLQGQGRECVCRILDANPSCVDLRLDTFACAASLLEPNEWLAFVRILSQHDSLLSAPLPSALATAK